MKIMKTKSLVRGTLSLAACIAASTPVLAEDWPEWGGNDPGRNMYSPAKGIPTEFSPGKFKPNSEEVDLSTTKNVKWVAKLGSQTYGNPVVANGKVYVGTNNATPRDERFKDDKSILMTLNEYTGEFLWQFVVPKLASGKVNDWEYLGLLSSPLVQGDKRPGQRQPGLRRRRPVHGGPRQTQDRTQPQGRRCPLEIRHDG
jgi:outer membrane protein assembly factor BamB